jgi:hypothetical protein
MSKITTKQYKKIQQVAQRFVAMVYGEFKNFSATEPSFRFCVGDFVCMAGYTMKLGWFCFYMNEDGNCISVEI